MAVYTGDFDAIFAPCWICPSVPKSGHNRLDMATHTTIWDRDKFLAIMKIDLRMLGLLFTLAFNSMLQSFRKEVMFPVEGGVAMKQWADALGAVALGLDGRPVFIRKREHDLDLRSSACVPSPWTMKRPFVSSPIDLRETKLIYVKQNGFHSLEVYNSC